MKSFLMGGGTHSRNTFLMGGSLKTLTQLIKSLFSNGEQGFFYDPNDLSTMYQNAAGTIPVTAAGQPVGLMLDKSGRNNHAYQSVSASRPVLQRNATTGAYYLAFDGTDDFLVTSSINFTATDKISLFAGVRKLSDVRSYSIVCELSADLLVNSGTFNLQAPGLASDKGYASDSKGTTNTTTKAQNYPAPHSSVLSFTGNISAPLNRLRVNANNFESTVSQGTGNYGNYPLYIGRRGLTSDQFINGHIYSLIGIGKLVSDNEIVNIEKELAKRVGVNLNV